MNRRTLFIILGLALGAGIIIALLFFTVVFRVTKITPDKNNFPSFAQYVDVYLSQPVASVDTVQFNGIDAKKNVTISGNKVRYASNDKFTQDSESTLILKGITSKNGRKLSVTYSFTPKYIDFNNLPKDVQKESQNKSSSGQQDDPFFNNYFPMVDVDDGFEIEYDTNPDTSAVSLYVTFYSEVFNYDTNQQTILPNDQAETMRTKVLDYIKKMGGKPEGYTIHWKNTYLENKYNPNAESEGNDDAH